MPWVSLANNQAVSYLNLWDASENTHLFAWRYPVPTTFECVTKNDVSYYLFINDSVPSFAAKASNELIVKEDLQQADGVFYSTDTGVFPLSGTGVSATGRIFNGTSSTIYLFALFNSGGLNSGTVNNDSFTIVPFAPRVVIGTITNFNQGIISNGLSIPPNTSYDITLNKNDGLLSGTTLRLAFSYNPSGLPTFNVTF
jgi:hypothetical protein